MSAIEDIACFADCIEQLQRIESFATTVDVGRGRTLWRPGRSQRQFLVIVDGEATVTVDGIDVATLGPGCGFGEVSVLTPRGRRDATVTATTPMTLLVLHRGEFQTLLQYAPVVVRRVQQESARRLARRESAHHTLPHLRPSKASSQAQDTTRVRS
jgi:CRP-like cAMP-binding protein